MAEVPMRPLRVLHCLYDVAGNAAALARCERELGLRSTAVALVSQPLGFHSDEVLIRPGAGYLRQEAARWRLLLRAMRSVDVIHFNFGRSIMPPWKGRGSASGLSGPRVAQAAVEAYLKAFWLRDLPILRRLGKALFVTFQGDDARQGDYCAANFEVSATPYVEPGYYSAESDAAKRQAIRRFDRYVDGLYAVNPDLLWVLPARAKFQPYASVDPRVWKPTVRRRREIPLIVHAPTHRGVKGTQFVLAAVERLRDEGARFDFRLVENLSHDEVKKLYEDADLLIDQLLVGWYGAVAVEFMAMAKPVICFVREGDLRFLPGPMRAALPIIAANPNSIEDVVRHVLGYSEGWWIEQGARCRAYAAEWHDPMRIAAELKRDYHDALSRHRRRTQPLDPGEWVGA